MIPTTLQSAGRKRGSGAGLHVPTVSFGERLIQTIDLSLDCHWLKFRNFFAYVPHSGRLSFQVGRNAELQKLPKSFRRERLALAYRVEVSSHRGQHFQHVTLTGHYFQQALEAVGTPRPHSRLESIGWRWVCSKCGEPAAILLAPLGRDFVCTECRRGGGDYVLAGNFVALPLEGRR